MKPRIDSNTPRRGPPRELTIRLMILDRWSMGSRGAAPGIARVHPGPEAGPIDLPMPAGPAGPDDRPARRSALPITPHQEARR